jgi:hypothetical protein
MAVMPELKQEFLKLHATLTAACGLTSSSLETLE